MAECKWCGKQTSFPKGECSKCWEFISQLNHGLHTKKLFYMMKRLVEARTREIHEDGHF